MLQTAAEDRMQSRSDLLIVLGPLAQIMPRVFLVMIAAAMSLIAAAYVGRAARGGWFIAVLFAYYSAAAAAAVGYLGIRSLMAYGSRASHDVAAFIEPLSFRGLRSGFSHHLAACTVLMCAGLVLAAIVRGRQDLADASAEQVMLERRES
jgi:hypothetical protein